MHIWEFVQREILGMAWLNRLVGSALEGLGLDTGTAAGAAVQFFIYDAIKIMTLLLVLITLISYVQSYFPPEKSRRMMGRFHGLGANIVAALLGTVTPFCSCSSIPLFIGFAGAGLPMGAAFSFLISSPMVDLASLMLLMSSFGWRVAAAYVLLGLMIAVVGGMLVDRLRLDAYMEKIAAPCCCCGAAPAGRWKNALLQAVATAKKLLPYVLTGVGVGALIHNWVPETLVSSLLGSRNPLGVVLAVLAGAPMYGDIFGTIPIAEALLQKGALLGVVLAFMMSVTTLSLPSVIMLRKAMKPRLLAVFIAICVAGIILSGYTFNLIAKLLLQA